MSDHTADKLLEAVEDGCWTVECEASPIADTGDADVGWNVIEYHMAEPRARIIGHGATPKLAIIDAINTTS